MNKKHKYKKKYSQKFWEYEFETDPSYCGVSFAIKIYTSRITKGFRSTSIIKYYQNDWFQNDWFNVWHKHS